MGPCSRGTERLFRSIMYDFRLELGGKRFNMFCLVNGLNMLIDNLINIFFNMLIIRFLKLNNTISFQYYFYSIIGIYATRAN